MRSEPTAMTDTFSLSDACSADKKCLYNMPDQSSSGQSLQSDYSRTADPNSAHASKPEDDLTSANPPLLAKLPAERLQHYLHVRMFESWSFSPDTVEILTDRNGTVTRSSGGTYSWNLPHLTEEDMSPSRNISLALQANQEFI